jgi:hypothetical protein
MWVIVHSANFPRSQSAEAVHKPNSVPEPGFPGPGNDHSSEDGRCRPSLATYPGARTGRSQSLPYLVLHRVGFTELLRSPGELVRSYRTFSPLPGTPGVPGGMLSVALSFTLPRLHVMEHPALRCSDFPPGYPNNPAIVWAASAEYMEYLLKGSKFHSFPFT